MQNLRLLLPLLLLLGLTGAITAFAEELPPSRVGRVSAAEGGISLRPAGGEWADSAVNDPIATGMAFRTAGAARATLEIGGDKLTLSGGTELTVVRLDDDAGQIALRQGRIGIHLARLGPQQSVAIELSRGAIRLLDPGDYDIVAGDEQKPARLVVFSGRAQFIGGGIDQTVTAGSGIALTGKSPIAATPDGATGDDFVASWRSATGDGIAPEALRYVSAEVTGYAALDAHGKWETADGLGAVWYPNALPDDWAPYRYGHWRWIAPWGWSWIDDAPWGFTTSHYGRWARIADAAAGSERWGWVPGRLVAHSVYAPALVAFLGTPGVGLSYPDAFGPAIAWFPLAPGEVYWPSFTGDLGLIRRINSGAVADAEAIGVESNGAAPAEIITGFYQNRRFASVVPRPVFLAGRAVAPALIQLPEQRLVNAPLLPGSPQIAPAPAHAAVAVLRPNAASAVHTLMRILSPRLAAAARHSSTVVLRPARPAPPSTGVASATHAAPGGVHSMRLSMASAAARPGRNRPRLAAVGRGHIH
jgi:hypothetical protein